MKIAIFGDSFSYVHNPKFSQGRAWTELLSSWGHTVSVFSKPGASQLWIYKEFLANHQGYDHVLVVKTSCQRLWIPHFPGDKQLFTSPADADHWAESQTLTATQREAVSAVHSYYQYLQSDQVDLITSQLILDAVKHSRPDSVILPALPWPNDPEPFHLWDVYQLNRRHWAEQVGADQEGFTWGDRLICHMNADNNHQLALTVDRWLKGDLFQLRASDYLPFQEAPEYWFPTSK